MSESRRKQLPPGSRNHRPTDKSALTELLNRLRVPLVKLKSPYSTKLTSQVGMPATRVLIADDNYFARQALRQMFVREKDFDVCGEAVNGRDAVRAAQLLRPDLIVLDLVMPVMNGIAAARMLKRLMPALPIILCLEIKDRCVEQATTAVGIAALVSKTEPLSSLVSKARALLTCKEAVPETASMVAAALPHLSARKQSVFPLPVPPITVALSKNPAVGA